MTSGLRCVAFWKERARALKTEIKALNLARRDPRVPRRAKIVVALVVAMPSAPST